MKHYHFEIQGFQRKVLINKEKNNFQIFNFSLIDVISDTEENAIKKAKSLVKKKYYRLNRMYECHYSEMDNDLELRMRMAALEAQTKAIKLLSPMGKE